MKPNRPSLILYFLALFATLFFDFFNLEFVAMYAKTIVVPSIFFYFLVSNQYVITKQEGLVFFCCFLGEVFDLMDVEISEMGSLFSFMIVYFILLKMILIDDSIKIKIKKIDLLPTLMIILFISYLLISILSLEFDKMSQFKIQYGGYGFILSFLSIVSFIEYITKGTNIALVMSVMSVCFIVSDLFYIFSQYYPFSDILVVIKDLCQILSYYFMTRYLLIKKTKNVTQ
ncbi:hypothetical protein SGQ44_06565 [Flavobacterium sp. Fl-77]|uniref:YhhN-like protein n=1 Tax=Flavobacterium flavipigmentatum TaxID=2893884 RepID=A0AAJ2VWR2_9FLAO|nr:MULTISPECIES: hypothetical protein [unclassified Flavobacterium]MDX6181553.1 hypothetical protein [Flavobacterium sp. Fl-33]MDX6185413.1 hypothetical protein [Flavobacterium sp. Fl-77]UFH37516.1 hypothetical protein LNP22_12295 [Flavobacterium sp. F-70]